MSRLWAGHDAAWRDPASVSTLWPEAGTVDPALLRFRVRGDFWDVLDETRATLIVSREYEHLLLALSVVDGRPRMSFLPLPHPSGLAYDGESRLYVAATRNPNQIFELRPITGLARRGDVVHGDADVKDRPLVPVATRFYPGSTYLHDLAFVGGQLHANAVGENVVVRVARDGALEPKWWPRSVETARGRPRTDRNYLQLNSIAPASSLRASYFTASIERPAARRPGQRHFKVDGRGVLFSGTTREPVVRGLTRPHSARRSRGQVWLCNSGYGEIGVADTVAGRFESVRTLDGWTRGLTFSGRFAFAATSRVIPRFSHYAPGVALDKSRAAVWALSDDGSVLGGIVWPSGNQIFALELVPRHVSAGLPFLRRRGATSNLARHMFYAFRVDRQTHTGGRTIR